MNTWIALFRGINVGGNNILPMAELRSELENLGYSNVHSYIQSGNVVFDTASNSRLSLANHIGQRIEDRYGFRPFILLLRPDDLAVAIEKNPFPETVAVPNSLHFAFLSEPPTSPDTEGLNKLKLPTERFKLNPEVFYLHAPEGIGRSKLAANAEKLLGVTATSRNYRTVLKIQAMIAK